MSTAQVNSYNQQANDFQFGEQGLLPVPQSPVPSRQPMPRLRAVPPPPVSSGDATSIKAGVAVAPRAKPFSKGVRQTPTDEIKQLENNFMQQMTRGTPKRPLSVPPSSAVLAPQTRLLPSPPTTVTQEFSAPTAPTYNQQLNAQPQVALPPLPYTAPTAPTYNQLLNSQAVTPSSVPSTPAPTFNQLLNSQTVTPSSVPSTTGQTYNQLLNCQVVTGQTYNQLLNCQVVTPPSVPGTVIETYNSQAVTPPFTPLTPAPPTNPVPVTQRPVPPPLRNNTALREPSLQLQGVYVTQGDNTAARARISGVYPLSPQALFGGTLDLTSNDSTFDDSRQEGLSINELYFATSFGGLPNLRFVVGQLDLTSYFDRNSFAKDGASQFFNPVFQTNPALAATGIASRTGLLVNWSATDNIEAKAAVFSSADRISDFALDGFAGEVAIRYGNAIIRATYANDRDAGIRDTFPESFRISRNPPQNTRFGPQEDDREEAYGLNAEVFIPNLKLGLFGRYGHYENRDLGEGADTYIVGASLLDLFTRDDRLGLAYGRALSNESLRRGDKLDVLELYYDFQFLPNLRLGFTIQGRDGFEETVFGVRVRSDLNIFPTGRTR